MNPRLNKARLAKIRHGQAIVVERRRDAARREAERMAKLNEIELQDTIHDLIFYEQADKPSEESEGNW